MARRQHEWMCSDCGHIQETYTDFCNECWEHEKLTKVRKKAPQNQKTRAKKDEVTFEKLKSSGLPPPVFKSGIDEFDRVFGEGLTEGASVFLAGKRGIGKSTLLLQVLAALSFSGKSCVYISGEEAVSNIQQRAKRLGIEKAPVHIAEAISVENTLSALLKLERVQVLVIDSIQSMSVARFRSAPGTPTQVRASAQALIRFAKRNNITLFMVGHVTKSGHAAGPEWIAHAADVVIHFSKDKDTALHILRCDGKNRFGPSDKVGVFRMTGQGLKEASKNDRFLYLENEDE